MIVMFVFLYPDHSQTWVVWLTLVLSLLVGAGAGYATMRWGHIGVLILGGWLGGLLGSIMYSCVFHLISESYPILFTVLSILAFAALVAYLSQVYFSSAVMVGSSLIGAFLFIRVRAYVVI